MYRRDHTLRNKSIAIVVLLMVAVVGVLAIFRYSYKAVPTVIITSGTSTAGIIATSTPPPTEGIITGIFSHPNVPKDTKPPAPILAQCVVGGCSRELCGDVAQVSTCLYRASYACYALARCERQSTGACGWTPTPTLQSCIAAANAQPQGDSPQ
jgi:hypothetical protein